MVMRDFKEKNHRLIMLRPSSKVLQSVQSLSEETITAVSSDAELVAVFKELTTTKRNQKIRAEVIDMSNGVPVGNAKDELTSTKL